MVNEGDYTRLNKSVRGWNDWRANNSNIIPDLTGADLSEFELIEVDFSQADLSQANLSWADLTGANFCEANLRRADLSKAYLSGADLSGANLSEANLTGASLSHAYFRWTDLSGADLSGTDLSGANLWGVNLTEADLSEANLSEANLTGANFRGAYLREIKLSEANLREADLRGIDLGEANLRGADLRKADLRGANLSGADLSGANLRWADLRWADLRGANLSRTQALETDFSNAKFTGACLEDWNYNYGTKLNNIDCQYVYLKSDKHECRPNGRDFIPGELTKFFQKALETVDLIFADGIDWQAFLTSFQKLQVECSGEELFIQAIENKNDSAFVIRVNVPRDANKAEIEKYLKREYDLAIVAIEEEYKFQLQAKDEQIAIYRKHSTDLTEIVKLMAERPIQNIIDVTAKAESQSMSESYKSKYDLSNAQVGGIVDTAQTGSRQEFNQYNYTPEQKQNLAEAAIEIQQLLNQLAQTNPTTDTVTDAIHQEIKSNPTLKARLISALKAGILEGLKTFVNHPLFNIPAETIKGFLEAE